MELKNLPVLTNKINTNTNCLRYVSTQLANSNHKPSCKMNHGILNVNHDLVQSFHQLWQGDSAKSKSQPTITGPYHEFSFHQGYSVMVSSCSGKVVSAAAFQTNKSMFNPQQKQAILMTCAGLGSNNPHKNVQIYFEQTNNRLHNLLPDIFCCNLSGAYYITRINMKQISETYKFLVCT